jgi:hypothetical protein
MQTHRERDFAGRRTAATLAAAAATRLAAAAALLLGACAPYVTHGPSLDAGPSFALTAGLTSISHSCYDTKSYDPATPAQTHRYCPEGDGGPAPLLVSAAHVWKPDPLGSGVRIGIDVPPWPALESLLFSQLGAFWQAPRAHERAVAWGAGAIISPIWIAPSAQFGRSGSSGRGWYTTQMIGYAHPVLAADEDFGVGWHPTIAYQTPCARCARRDDVAVTLRVFVSGGFERSPLSPWEHTDARHYWTRIISAGVSLEGRSLFGMLAR